MDEISLTDLRRRYFGPTLDESVLYGIEYWREFFGGRFGIGTARKTASNTQMYKSCDDVSSVGSSKDENGKSAGKMGTLSLLTELSPPSQVTTALFSSTLTGSKTKEKKTRSSPTGRAPIDAITDNKAKQKKDLANSYISGETKTRPPSFAPSSSTPTVGRQQQRSPRSNRKPSSSISSPSSASSTPAKRRPKLVRSRWGLVRVKEFDDGAKTYEIFQGSSAKLLVPGDDGQKALLDDLFGAPTTTANGSKTTPATSEIVFATLPDGSSLSYRGGQTKIR